jgi:hypothetical protein
MVVNEAHSRLIAVSEKGQIYWQTFLDPAQYSLAAPTVADGTLYAAADDGWMYAFNLNVVSPGISDFGALVHNLEATFSAASGSGSLFEYNWDFGDGSNGTGMSVVHVYAAAGTYQVHLAISNLAGQVAGAIFALTVHQFTAPRDFAAVSGEGKVTLSWVAPADSGGFDIISYKVYRAVQGGSPSLLATVSGSNLTYIDDNGTVGTNYTWQVDADDSANHHVGTTETAFTFTVVALPDLIVESLTHSPANPTTADLITFTAVVKNVGTGSAGGSTLLFTIGGETPGASGTLFPVPALGSGASHTVTRQLTLNVAQGYINTATADYNHEVAESNEANNTTEDRYTVIPAGALSTIFGKIMYNESPVTGKPVTLVNFWARDENSGLSFPISPIYNPSDGTYSIPNMPTGKYGI